MRNTYVECLDWTWPEKLLYIKACVGNEVPHNMLCGYAASSRDEILLNYMHAKYLYCNERGMISYDDKDLSKPSITRNQRRVELSDLKPRTRTEYEKVTYDSAWKAAKDHEERNLELWRKSDLNEAIKGNDWKAIQSPSEAAQYHFDLYLRVEKEIDWRVDAHTKLQSDYHWSTPIAEVINDESDYFLELCRVALRANGEIE